MRRKPMFSKLKSFVDTKAALVAGTFLAAPAIFAEDPVSSVTLPETGCDISSYVTAAITKLGPVVGVCIAGVFAFMVVRWGVRWARGIGRA